MFRLDVFEDVAADNGVEWAFWNSREFGDTRIVVSPSNP
jgi:hypothetical protein